MLPALLAALTLTALPDYEQGRADLERTRQRLAREAATNAPAARDAARVALLRFYDEVVFPSWAGTPWDFNGVSLTPGKGQIACGYYVSTTLLHAGFRVQRVLLAQQFSTDIVRSMASPQGTVVLRGEPRAAVVARARALGPPGLRVVGLDNHVGFLRVTADAVQFCHANYVGPEGVTCEDPLTSRAFESTTWVLGDAFTDERLDDWLRGTPITTLRTPRAR